MKEDEITWQSMLIELVKTEEMDPWDVDMSHLSQRFLELLRTLKSMNLNISGKVVLAAAILLKMKTNRLFDDDLAKLDGLIAASEQVDEEFMSELDELGEPIHGLAPELGSADLIPRTPQPRKRKVSIYDLVDALEKALQVEARRPPKPLDNRKLEIPKKAMDISIVIRNIYQAIIKYLDGQENQSIKFSQLIPSESKEDKIFTFIPLLHLTNQRKVDLEQEAHFHDFDVILLDAKTVPVEVSPADIGQV